MNPRFIDEMSWRMAEVYGAVTDRILINLAHHFKRIQGNEIPGSFDYQVKKLAEIGQVTKETEQIILSMLGDADGALQSLLEASIRDSLTRVEPSLRKAAEKGLIGRVSGIPEVSPNQMQAFRAFYQQSADKLNLVNTVMLESTQAAYQSTVADIVGRMNAVQGILNTETGAVVSGVSPLNHAIKSGVQRMVQTGITGYIDHGGHHWSPEAYVAMDVRTTMANTARAAVWERNEQYGNDLYQVSHHDGARPLCYDWQGKVISRDDLSRDVEDDEGNIVHVYAQSETTYGQAAGLFGINCKHYPIPFVPGFSRIRPPEQDKETNDKEYAESQQQRTLERRLRYEKRDLEVLKAQGATDEEIKIQRLRVKDARSKLDDFCEETGRARRSSREYTPIKAKWPDIPDATPTPRMPRTPRNPAVPAAPVVPAAPAPAVPKATGEIATKILPRSGIAANDLTKWDHTPTTEEIIRNLGGADQTNGSCSSLAFAYSGNRGGYEVLDFRGGDSCSFFARNGNIAKIVTMPGVDGKVVSNYNDFKAAHEVLQYVEPGKEYYFGCGRHAAIVRRNAGKLEYLELQSARNNGFHELDDERLRYRFGCKRSHTIYGQKYELQAEIAEVDKLKNNADFLEILRYINTAGSQQRKGLGGGIR